MSDIESIDNSTDDPDYMSEPSVVTSSSDGFVSPKKPRPRTKDQKRMASKSAPSDSPGASFNLSLSQIDNDMSQANVVFKKSFDDARPGRFIFVTEEGKIARSKKFALKRDSDGFILIFSTTADWTEYCLESLDSNITHDKVFQTLSDVPGPSGDINRFDKLLWTNPDSMNAEIPLDSWYSLMEKYSNSGLNLTFTKILSDNSDTKVGEENSEQPARTGEKLLGAIPKPVSSKFNFKLIDEDNSDFIERNMSPNTLKVNRTASRLFNNFMKQVHPELLHDTLESVDEHRLPSLLPEFFKILQKDENQKYNASTLQSYYMAACRVLKLRRKIIIKDNPLYEECRSVLSRQQKISCDHGQRPGLNKSQAFPPELLAEAWAKGVFGSTSPKALVAALLLTVGPSFGIRGKEELADIRIEDFILGPRRADGVISNIRYNERKTKTRVGVDGQGARNIEPIMYPDDQRPDRCPVRLFDLYQSKKPKEMLSPDCRFFLGCKNTKQDWKNLSVWFTSQPMGKHMLASLVPDQIKTMGGDTQGLKLTGVSTRKTGIDGALSSGMPPTYVACLAGQKTLAAQTHYMSPTDATLKATSRMISNVVNGETSSSKNFNELLEEERNDVANKIAAIKAAHETPKEVDETSGPTADTNEELIREKSPPPEVEEDKSKPRHKSRRSKHKKSKKKKRKHHRRYPSTSSSSSSSSSVTTSSSSEEDSKEALKRKLKKEKKKRKKLQKENRPPQGMYVPMMMPMPMMSFQGHPNMNANFPVPPVPQSGQMLSQQITQHTLKATSTSSNANPSFIRDQLE